MIESVVDERDLIVGWKYREREEQNKSVEIGTSERNKRNKRDDVR